MTRGHEPYQDFDEANGRCQFPLAPNDDDQPNRCHRDIDDAEQEYDQRTYRSGKEGFHVLCVDA